MPESKKSSLKSVALAVQQLKIKYLTKEQQKAVRVKKADMKKCNQQWKHPKNNGNIQWWKTKTPEKTVMKNPKKLS